MANKQALNAGKIQENKIIEIRKIIQSKKYQNQNANNLKQQSQVSDNETSQGLNNNRISQMQINMQAVILHTQIDEILFPLTDNYPLALANIVNKPILCYQLEYLQSFGIQDIQITIEKQFANKIERYLKNHFKNLDSDSTKSNIELIVFQEEEDPVGVLKALQHRIHGDFILIEGKSIIEVPIDEILDSHRLNQNSLTSLIKEFDMLKGGNGAKLADFESQDIFGISNWAPENARIGDEAINKNQSCRIVFKTSKTDSKSKQISVKTSLLRKCNDIKIRSDLALCGIHIFSYPIYKLICYADQTQNYQWSSIQNDVIPYLARNQFKEKLIKMQEEATKELKNTQKSQKNLKNILKDRASRLDNLLNYNQTESKYQIKIMGYIDPMNSQNICMRINSTKLYMKANLEGQKILNKYQKSQNLKQYKAFAPTINNIPDLVQNYPNQVEEWNVQIKESNIAVINNNINSAVIGEGSVILKSVIGRNIKIGQNVKISNSVILGNCNIGDDSTIQNCLILTKCNIGNKNQIKDDELEHQTQI